MEKERIEEEINFKALLKKPVRLFGWVYFYIFVIIVLAGIFFANHMNATARNSASLEHIDSLDVKREIKQVRGGVQAPVQLTAIYNPRQELVDRGMDVYIQNCRSCHGDEGEGDGPAGATLEPAPRNFHETDGWVHERSFAGMFKTLQEGIPNTAMTAYDFMPVEDRIAVIQYIRKNFDGFPEITEKEAEELDAEYNFTAGEEIPSQIPVNRAMELLKQENRNSVRRYVDFADFWETNKNNEDYSLLSESVENPSLFLSVIAADTSGLSGEFREAVKTDPPVWGLKVKIRNYSGRKIDSLFTVIGRLKDSAKG